MDAETPGLATHPDGGTSGMPPALMWLLGPAAAVAMGLDARRWWRASRRNRGICVAALEPGHVTVLGFGGPHDSEVVFVPGATSPGVAFELLQTKAGTQESSGRDFGGPVFAGPVGRKLGELVAGDVLVCHGVLEPGRTVQLSNAAGHGWVPGLRIPYRSEIFKEPYTEPHAEPQEDPQEDPAPAERVTGRRVRVVPTPVLEPLRSAGSPDRV